MHEHRRVANAGPWLAWASRSSLDCPDAAFRPRFFLHITGGPDSINNILALAFGLLIVFVVVACSMWIMADLNDNMLMPSADPMDRAMATRVFRSELVSRRFLA